MNKQWNSSVISVKALSSGSCCSQVFYRITVLNILKKNLKEVFMTEPFTNKKDFSPTVFLRIFFKNFRKTDFQSISGQLLVK